MNVEGCVAPPPSRTLIVDVTASQRPTLAWQPGLVPVAWLEQLRRAERQAVRAALSSFFVHKLGTPLNVILGRARMVLGADDLDEGVKRNAQVLFDTAQQLVKDVQAFADSEKLVELRPELTDMSQLVRQALTMFEPIAESRDIEIVAEDMKEAPTFVDPLRALLLITSKLGAILGGTGGKVVVALAVRQVDEPADLRCAPGAYVTLRMRREGRNDGDEEPADSQHDAREDVHVARMLGGFVVGGEDGAEAWELFWPQREASK
jgi:hypothetical protein